MSNKEQNNINNEQNTSKSWTNCIIIKGFCYSYSGYGDVFRQSTRSLNSHLRLLKEGELKKSDILTTLLLHKATVYFEGELIDLNNLPWIRM